MKYAKYVVKITKISRCTHLFTKSTHICAAQRRENEEEMGILRAGWGNEISIFGQKDTLLNDMTLLCVVTT